MNDAARYDRLNLAIESLFSKITLPETITDRIRTRFPDVFSDIPHFSVIGESMCGTTTLYQHLIRNTHVLPVLERHTGQFFKPSSFSHERYFQNYIYYLSKSLRDEIHSDVWIGDEDPHLYLIDFEKLMRKMEEFYVNTSHDLDSKGPWFAGDQSTCFSTVGAERIIWELNPNIKLLLILRDPVQRGYSFFHRVHVHEDPKGLRIEEAIEIDDLRSRHSQGDGPELNELMAHPYQSQVFGYGLYIEHLERWLNYFPLDQILIIDNRELTADPQGVLDSVTEFIGIPREKIDGMKDTGQLPDKAPLNSDTKAFMKEFFRPYNEKLYEKIGKDFGW